MVEVVVTDEFHEWYEPLTEEEQEAIVRVVTRLAQEGVALRHPHSSAINGASFALRELRAQYQGRPYRVFYAFDSKRQAVLLIGGDKTGRDRFYEEMLPKSERIWKDYLDE